VTGVDKARKVLADRIANTLDSLPPAYLASSGGDLDMGIVVPLKALRTVLEASPASPAEDERAARSQAMDEAWGFREKTRPQAEKWNAEHWFRSGWDASTAFHRPAPDVAGLTEEGETPDAP
jgi:hypothetical protein